MERHRLPDDPANNDEERGNQKGDLNAGADCDAHGQVHLVTNGNHHGRDMLRRVSNNRDQDKTNEGLADAGRLDEGVDAANEVVGADSDQNGGDDKHRSGGNGAQDGLFFLVVLLVAGFGDLGNGTGFGIEEVAVGAQLEDQIENVEQQENNGGAAREDQDAVGLVLGLALVKDGIELHICQFYTRSNLGP